MEFIHEQTHTLNIIGVIKSTGLEFENYLKYASLCRPVIADEIVDKIRGHKPSLLAVWSYFTVGALLFLLIRENKMAVAHN